MVRAQARAEHVTDIAAAAFIDGMPYAFVAIDLAFNVIAWNPAAERLFGYAAEEVLGRPPVYLPPDDDALLRATLGHGSADSLPRIFTRLRSDGAPIQVLVEREIALHDSAGRLVGHGRFIRPVVNEQLRLHQRNMVSQELAQAVRMSEVRDVLGRVMQDVLGAEVAIVFRPVSPSGLAGMIGTGLPQEHVENSSLEMTASDRLSMRGGAVTEAMLDLPDGPRPALLVPMGPSSQMWVLALGYPQSGLQSYENADFARVLASELWEACRRLELVNELEAQVEILEAHAAVRATAGLDLDAVLEGVCRAALGALSCERAAVYLHEGTAIEQVAVSSSTPLGDTAGDGTEFAIQVAAGEAIVVRQDTDPSWELDGLWGRGSGAVAVMGMPLRVGDRSLGALVVAHTTAAPRGFTRLCMRVADAVAREAALSIDNARLFGNERATVQRLEELDRLKADYMAGITHDLRTPLTLLLGFVRTLRGLDDRVSDEERREYLEIMERHALRLTGLVGDLMLGARLEAGELAPDERREVALDALLSEGVAGLDPHRRARVVLSIEPGLRVLGDSSQLLRVMHNLLDNALKFSGGPVEVTAAAVDGAACICVRDEGPGVPEEEVSRLFTRFAPGRSRDHGGTGLGLSIVRGIVEGHGGTVTLEPGPVGAVFAVRLPLA